MDRDESKEYIKVKKAILKRYELTSEAYRRKFRNSRRANVTPNTGHQVQSFLSLILVYALSTKFVCLMESSLTTVHE
jgi:hypothetical protein